MNVIVCSAFVQPVLREKGRTSGCHHERLREKPTERDHRSEISVCRTYNENVSEQSPSECSLDRAFANTRLGITWFIDSIDISWDGQIVPDLINASDVDRTVGV